MHPDVLRTKKVSNESNLTVTTNSSSQQTSSSTFDCTSINPSNGAAALFLEAAINSQQNDPAMMQRRKERKTLADATKVAEGETQKLTSGVAFYNDMVALNGDTVWEHPQKKWHDEKTAKERSKRNNTAKRLFQEKKVRCDNIRK